MPTTITIPTIPNVEMQPQVQHGQQQLQNHPTWRLSSVIIVAVFTWLALSGIAIAFVLRLDNNSNSNAKPLRPVPITPPAQSYPGCMLDLNHIINNQPSWPTTQDAYNNMTFSYTKGTYDRFAYQNKTRISINAYAEFVSKAIEEARVCARNPNFDQGFKRAVDIVVLRSQSKYFGHCQIYSFLWAYLAERGRMTASGHLVSLTDEQLLKFRSLEALRAGWEELLNESFSSDIKPFKNVLSCLQGKRDYNEQIIALHNWCKTEYDFIQTAEHPNKNVWIWLKAKQQMIGIVNSWYDILEKYNVPKTPKHEKFVMMTQHVSRGRYVNHDVMCPAPLPVIASKKVRDKIENSLTSYGRSWFYAAVKHFDPLTYSTLRNGLFNAWFIRENQYSQKIPDKKHKSDTRYHGHLGSVKSLTYEYRRDELRSRFHRK